MRHAFPRSDGAVVITFVVVSGFTQIFNRDVSMIREVLAAAADA